MRLRPYQQDIITEARYLMTQGHRSILISSPTGSGKTLLTAHMLKTSSAKGLSSWFIVHRRELIEQSIRQFKGEGVEVGVIASGFEEDRNKPIQICSIQTLSRRLDGLFIPDLLVWDECHHVAARSWEKIFTQSHWAYQIGLTATPERLDGKGLSKYFAKMVSGPGVSELIDHKYLAPYRLFAPHTIDVSGVHKRMGDFVRNELAEVCDRPTITGNAILEYQKHSDGQRALVFCVSIEHSKHVCEQFRSYGYRAKHIDGETPKAKRDQAIKDFRSGKIQVITNCDLFGEGFDLPAIQTIILLRPTKSLGLHRQQIGRGLRTYPGKKEAIILDHAGNTFRHGLPDDEIRWSLEGKKGREQGGANTNLFPVRQCPKCFGVTRPHMTVCPYCKNTFPIQSREIEEEDGELVELNPLQVQARRKLEQRKARTLEALVKLGKSRGFKNPWGWAHHILRARERKYG